MSASDLFLGALALAREDKFAPALSLFESALSLDPKHHRAAFGIGLMHHCQGRYEEAIKAYTVVITLSTEFWARPYSARALARCALLDSPISFVRPRNYGQVLEDVDLALRIDAEWDQAHFVRGLVLIRMRQLHAAQRAFAAAIRVVPFGPALYARAHVRFRTRNKDGALSDLGNCLQLNWEPYLVHLLRAEIMEYMGQFAEANAARESAKASIKWGRNRPAKFAIFPDEDEEEPDPGYGQNSKLWDPDGDANDDDWEGGGRLVLA